MSPTKAKLVVMVYSVSKATLSENQKYQKITSKEIFSMELPIFSFPSIANRKNWGCPITPLILLGKDVGEHENIPHAEHMKKAIANFLSSMPSTANVQGLKSWKSNFMWPEGRPLELFMCPVLNNRNGSLEGLK